MLEGTRPVETTSLGEKSLPVQWEVVAVRSVCWVTVGLGVRVLTGGPVSHTFLSGVDTWHLLTRSDGKP